MQDEPEEGERPQHVIVVWRGATLTMEFIALCLAGFLSTLVLVGCFVVLLAPTDDRSEQAAIALATSIVTAWITKFGSQFVGGGRR